MSTEPTITTFEQAEAMMALTLPRYAPRLTQQRAALAVEGALALGEHLLLQAGTGTGKSFALLIPAILSGRRVIVSTATKALQSQYIYKDLPFLAEHLGRKFTYALLQGRSNYLCTQRAVLTSTEEPMVADILAEADAPGFSGLRSDFSFDIPDGLWHKVNGNTEECDELGCKTRGGCFVLAAREEASLAQVVVVNHALLATDISVGGNPLLGDFRTVVVDEVHELVKYAIEAFESYFSELTVRTLQAQLRSFAVRVYGGTDRLEDASRDLTEANSLFWLAMTSQMPEKEDKLRITSDIILHSENEWVGLSTALWAFAKAVSDLPLPIAEEDVKRFRLLRKQAQNLANKFDGFIRDEFSTTVRWVEHAANRRTGKKHLVVRSQPIEVGPFLQDCLFKSRTVVGASATVAVGGRFDYVAGRLGFEDNFGYRGLDVGTNFNYQRQALTYIPAIPVPARETAREWEAAVPAQVQALLAASSGRALVLFTSIERMNKVYSLIADTLPWTVYKQGDMPHDRIVAAFKADVHSVLFATKTFFTGVDIQGEALSMVILDKLPFPSPGDPVVEATSDLYDARYGERGGWKRYMLPETQMALEQAYGRLIRDITDRGVFACLDSRLLKGWGANMAAKLPPAPRVRDIGSVQAFFSTPSAPEDGYDEEPF
jgi:ATP-dependent DNA helicase DinG